ncbi:hypothetical protein [Streptomyces zaomyceticus]|uniref:hypothetical protein n=1 Tax=Streptomyces zaomyceticus TaxID=68286 RepID=UPI002E14B10F|nr:hypothetical protein OG237_01990 [Streptomyces zaomyceticus]
MVWDHSTDGWEVFRFDRCATYALSNWEGSGFYGDNQTGGRATATLYGQGGRWLKNVPISAPPTGAESQDWSPVWSIRNCY